ncbi:hypothetical protein LHP98_07405 [Rhodobacter sp. Har01]|uniref:hypothetical protein n=1 Tax=Rhodobacter sp. Har01 TaxID=2883999 RepID=UPI001D07AB87|nr:hypothetical protein [Rhodobacter sp. Har01]MCB6177956.1 hypothetical protein [Rhodobacter sp. Har01]
MTGLSIKSGANALILTFPLQILAIFLPASSAGIPRRGGAPGDQPAHRPERWNGRGKR